MNREKLTYLKFKRIVLKNSYSFLRDAKERLRKHSTEETKDLFKFEVKIAYFRIGYARRMMKYNIAKTSKKRLKRPRPHIVKIGKYRMKSNEAYNCHWDKIKELFSKTQQ